MSPELINVRKHSEKVDIWSLGILFYEMLHGKPPFKASTFDEISNELNSKKIIINSDLSPEIKDLLRKILNGDPMKRYNIDQLL